MDAFAALDPGLPTTITGGSLRIGVSASGYRVLVWNVLAAAQ